MALTDEGLIEVPGMLSRWVRLANGERAHYMTSGETGPAVVLLHGGIPGSSGLAGWRILAPLIAQAGFRVYCPDQPGFGLSDPRPEYWPIHGPYSHANFLERFVEALCLDEFFLSGNSMGCINTAHYLVRFPHRVKRFVLIAGPVGDLVPFGQQDLRKEVGWDGTRDTMIKMMNSIIHHREAITDDLLEMRMRSADVHEQSWIAWQKATLHGEIPADVATCMSTKDRLDKLEIPGLCLYGRNDVILPVEELGYRVEDALPKVQFFYPDDCGHQGQTDQPELFARVFVEFFRDGIVSRETARAAGVSTRRPENPALVEARRPATV
ncbi:2-hydroxy-6-ketonona-2,4-dienedioic acid hydrolase [Mycobacterium saskatchewanense]|uniref:2-hydroxy-6-oxo-6-phenylhexa-2,4-dienoate hydrolase n=1 Tax=Mycobacterium saskatchewanense TaxID=220927 RepID=A0AAJ3TWD2_9MYCO|nr:alpha/beta hydrolase [Mycobacterium saskatchewanense]ORW73728.1 2-hydroxy-6-oxo-6-phenylhexa-2,4-dienoate hydrolase [Mycobacterium saskatchewanense]BBX65194.1 2-hydroxy-6-ketonona-2,4-dienedioic acid hydrolase [Mycobacterium saskatchewanense]